MIETYVENVVEKFEKEAVPETCEFKFECKPDCWSRCCSNFDILLTPYDIDSISRYLGISNVELIDNYCQRDTEGNALFPICILDTTPCCKFNKKRICEIYAARPLICRLYPVCRAYYHDTKEEKFIIDKKCKGIGHGKTFTIKSFLENQGVNKYSKIMKMFYTILEEWCLLPAAIRLRLNREVAIICYHSEGIRTQSLEQLFEDRMKNLRNLIIANASGLALSERKSATDFGSAMASS